MIKENFKQYGSNEKVVQLNIVLEHFSFEMQAILDKYMADEIDFD